MFIVHLKNHKNSQSPQAMMSQQPLQINLNHHRFLHLKKFNKIKALYNKFQTLIKLIAILKLESPLISTDKRIIISTKFSMRKNYHNLRKNYNKLKQLS
jgi:hypothetical protein